MALSDRPGFRAISVLLVIHQGTSRKTTPLSPTSEHRFKMIHLAQHPNYKGKKNILKVFIRIKI